VLLHVSCHNPTGADLDLEQLSEVVDPIVAKSMVHLVDAAYLGLGVGFAEDVKAPQLIVSRAPEALVAFSCSKNLGLYRERIGAFLDLIASSSSTTAINCHVQYLARTVYSTPPNHGAATVATILGDPAMKKLWLSEPDTATAHINAMRTQLASYGRVGEINLGVIASQKGMFALLPLSVERVSRLKDEFSIYMAPSGHVNLAGLSASNIPYFVSSLTKVIA
jgi:aromatic-amino-acid transaminase